MCCVCWVERTLSRRRLGRWNAELAAVRGRISCRALPHAAEREPVSDRAAGRPEAAAARLAAVLS